MNYPTLPAPPLEVSHWLNTNVPITLESLRGKVVVIYVFQMLCPGCVIHGLPQVQSVRKTFSEPDVAVLGLHSVFEHHDVMTPKALEAFAHEYRLTFPIGIDKPANDSPIPKTMRRYMLNGTPSLLLLDRAGRLRSSHFGQVDDMRLGALIAQLVSEQCSSETVGTTASCEMASDASRMVVVGCDDTGCPRP